MVPNETCFVEVSQSGSRAIELGRITIFEGVLLGPETLPQSGAHGVDEGWVWVVGEQVLEVVNVDGGHNLEKSRIVI